MALTRVQIFQALADELGDAWFGTSNASGGTTTALVDTSDDSPMTPADDNSRFGNTWLYSRTSTNAGIERRIGPTGYVASTSTLTASRAFPATLNSNDYEIHANLSRLQKNALLDVVLTQRLCHWQRQPLTVVTDGDMEASGTSDWTNVSNMTIAKTSTAGEVLFGTQALKLTAGAANAVAASASIPVRAGDTWRFEVWVKCGATSSVTIVPYDATQSAEITITGDNTHAGTGATGGGDWVKLDGTFVIPSGCASLTFRLKEATSGAISYWDDLIATDGRTHLPLPSWLTTRRQYEWVYIRSGDTPREERWVEARNARVFLSPTETAGGTVQVSEEAAARICYVRGIQYYSALTSDTATTLAPKAWVVPELALICLNRLAAPFRDNVDRMRQEIAAYWLPRVMAARQSYEPVIKTRHIETFWADG